MTGRFRPVDFALWPEPAQRQLWHSERLAAANDEPRDDRRG